jgi:Mrp family chromosome partitioning ATPase/capsular polysaccharide biosynthesis protein
MTFPEGGFGQVPSGADWRRPRFESAPLTRYIETVRERFWLIVLVLFVTTAASVVYLQVAQKTYEASADMLVTPVPSTDPIYAGLGLIRDSNDPTRDVETAAKLVTTRDVAQRVKDKLGGSQGTRSLLNSVKAEPVAQSNIVAITSSASSPAKARDIANGFAAAVVADRTAKMRNQLAGETSRLRQRISQGGDTGTGPDSLRNRLLQLETLASGGDPTLRSETRADTPPNASSPRPFRTLAAGILAGLVLGIGGAFAFHALDPRLRREEQLRERYSLPILARVPKEKGARTSSPGERRFGIGPHRRHRRALGPRQLSPATLESYRTLRAMLTASHPADTGRAHSILITGPSPSEGKTTTAINVASSYALAGASVILIEADFRRPTVGEALGVRSSIGIGKVLLGTATLEEALVPVNPFGDSLRALLVDRAGDWLAEVLSLPAAGKVLERAVQMADVVVIDSPPLTEVIDALPLAQQVDDVLMVVRLGSSSLSQLGRLGDLLEQNNVRPSGFVVIGSGSSDEQTYYLAAREERTRNGRPSGDRDDERERLSSAEA